MIDYVGIMRFGIWATMTAILHWVVFFDLGLGNGLRNTLVHALAQNERERACAVISTGYFTIGAISLIILVLLYIMTPILNLKTIFNAHLLNDTELKWTLLIIGTCIISIVSMDKLMKIWHSLPVIRPSSPVTRGGYRSPIEYFTDEGDHRLRC